MAKVRLMSTTTTKDRRQIVKQAIKVVDLSDLQIDLEHEAKGMEKDRMEQQEKQEWTLESSGLVVRRGDLIEYRDKDIPLAGMVVAVNIVGYTIWGSSGPPKGTQIIAIKQIKNRRLPKTEELADTTIESTQVVRTLQRKGDTIPLPPPVARTLFSPFDPKNPWYINTFLTPEEWKGISRWYQYSLRALLFDGSWNETGRYQSRDAAYQVMKVLVDHHINLGAHAYVIISCSLQGAEGREKAVVGMPGSLPSILQERERLLAGRR